MNQLTKLILSIVSIAMLLITGACGQDSESSGQENTLKLGLISSTTGRGAAYGQSQNDGTALAIEMINQQGGINGIPIKVFQEDDKSEPSTGVTVSKKLIEKDQVDVIIGSPSSLVTLGFMQVNNQMQVPLVVAMAGSPKITDMGYNYVWRFSVTDLVMDVRMVEYLIQEEGKKTFAFLAENSDYGLIPTEAAVAKIEELGGEVVTYEQYNPGETDFKAQLTKIKQSEPDIIFTHGYYTEGSIIVRQIKELGIEGQIVVNSGQGVPKFSELAGAAAEGVIFPSPWLPGLEKDISKSFEEAFVKKYNRQPGAFDAMSYDAVLAVAEAVRLGGGTSREQIQAGLKQLNGFELVTGVVNLNENNQNDGDVVVGIFQSGQINVYTR